MVGVIVFIIGISIFLVFGVVATFWTERLRSYWIRQADRHPKAIHWRIVGRRVRSQWYSVELQLIGIMCLGTALFVICAFAREWLYG